MALLVSIILALVFTLTLQSYPVIQSDVLFWLNRVRTNPSSIIPHLQQQLSKFKGLNIPIAPFFNYATKQGPSAWIEAINYLRNQRPMGALERHPGLDRAAYDHAVDLRQYNTIRHQGTDGSKPKHRIQRHCVYEFGQISENIAQQFVLEGRNHGLQTIVSLIVDDGVGDRGHRHSLFTQKYKYAGVNVQRTQDHYVVVIQLSSHNLQLKSDRQTIIASPSSLQNMNLYHRDLSPLNLNIYPQVHFKDYQSHKSFTPIIRTQTFNWRHIV